MVKKELKEGQVLLLKGCGLIDTSNRTRKLNEKSVLALASKNIGFTVLLKSSDKKLIFKKLIESKNYSKEHAIILIHEQKYILLLLIIYSYYLKFIFALMVLTKDY